MSEILNKRTIIYCFNLKNENIQSDFNLNYENLLNKF